MTWLLSMKRKEENNPSERVPTGACDGGQKHSLPMSKTHHDDFINRFLQIKLS